MLNIEKKALCGTVSDLNLPEVTGMPKTALSDAFKTLNMPDFRARQLWHWLYTKGVTDFSQMTSLGKNIQEVMAQRFSLARPVATQDITSLDGTRKWLLRFADGAEVETVYIPDADRGTLCISSQVGCTLNCHFCHTGTQAWARNLSIAEIVGQVLYARDALGEWGKLEEKRRISNIVLMGMGEPLYNFDNVAAALHILMDGEGVSLSKRKITLSTAGVVPMMDRCGNEIGVNLAVSLHAVRDDIRDIIVPLNRRYPINELMDACRRYPGASNARRITFEYVMLKGVNDSDADAKGLVALLKDIPAKVNLIPFNPWPGAPYECSSNNRIRSFATIVNDGGLAAPVRTPRGRDILAACGQLKSTTQRQPKRLS
jgi:23S rRNA (adenine2503-C2)-methyltransferase